MMKKYLTLIAWSAGFLPLQAQFYSLDILEKSGETTVIPLHEFDRITFAEESLVVKFESGTTQSFDKQAIRKLLFNYPSSMEEVASFTDKPFLYPNPATDYLYLKNVSTDPLEVTIYSLSGPVMVHLNRVDPAQAIDIQQLPQGIYLLKVNQYTLKFTKL